MLLKLKFWQEAEVSVFLTLVSKEEYIWQKSNLFLNCISCNDYIHLHR